MGDGPYGGRLSSLDVVGAELARLCCARHSHNQQGQTRATNAPSHGTAAPL